MNVYPYKIIKTGKFTKYVISIVSDGSVLVTKIVKGSEKLQKVLRSKEDVLGSQLPKNIIKTSLWAKYEAQSLIV